MNEIELYDIITLKDESEYTVLNILENKGKKYFLLAPVDENETPNMEEIRIVEEIVEDDKTIVQEIDDEELLQELSVLFLNSLKESLTDDDE